jgi:hypothetical protein
MAVIGALRWGIVSLYGLKMAAVSPVVQSSLVAIAVYPLLDLVLAPFVLRAATAPADFLTRGG